MTAHLRLSRKAPERSWLDDALDRRAPAVIRADFTNQYRLIGAFPDGSTCEVMRQINYYVEEPQNIWDESELPTPNQAVRASFHSSSITSDMIVNSKEIPEAMIAEQLFAGLTEPVYDAYNCALREMKMPSSSYFEYEAQKHLLKESPHWYELLAPRHAVPVMRVRHGVYSDTYSMCLEWANLKRQ